MEGKKHFATGRRKTSVARVWIEPGQGKITINALPIDDYFSGLATKKQIVRQPLELVKFGAKHDVFVNVYGGGLTGQAEAIRHGISRTLILINPEFRTILKRASLLTRDSRIVERKKYGQPGARKRFQFSKR